MTPRTWVEIDTGALKHNLRVFKHSAPKSQIMPIVKSNAYGHGLVGASKVFIQAGADWLGVDSLQEAVSLRKNGIKKPILILGYVPQSELKLVFDYKLRLVVYNLETINKLARLAKNKRKILPVHLKIETGTNRQGILIEDLPEFITYFKKNKFLILEGVSTHFANIEDVVKQAYAQLQLKRLKEALKILRVNKLRPKFIHCAASAAVLVFPESHFNLVRPGFGLYGLWPSERTKEYLRSVKSGIILKPALIWKTKVIQIKKVPKGSPIGYGLTERVKKNSRLAVLPVGYWDGYDRRLSSRGEVLINGKRAKVLGRICMNMMMVDITSIPKVKLENPVVLIGPEGKQVITAEDLAHKIGTIGYEIVTRINPLIPRFYL